MENQNNKIQSNETSGKKQIVNCSRGVRLLALPRNISHGHLFPFCNKEPLESRPLWIRTMLIATKRFWRSLLTRWLKRVTVATNLFMAINLLRNTSCKSSNFAKGLQKGFHGLILSRQWGTRAMWWDTKESQMPPCWRSSSLSRCLF